MEIKKKLPNVKPVELAEHNQKALMAYNLMKGELDWGCIEAVLEYLSVDNFELIIDQILEIISYQKSISNV